MRATSRHTQEVGVPPGGPGGTPTSEVCQATFTQKFVDTSSMTKLVCSEESSVSANFSVTFVPL